MPRSPTDTAKGSLTKQVTDRLRKAILDAEFGLGEALSEDKLAAAFGISRTPVRDSLTALQIQGLIDIKPQRGSFVFFPTVQDVTELCEIRSILEVQTLRLSVVRNKEITLQKLREANDKMEAAKAIGDFQAVAQWDTAFHAALVACSGNKYLVEAYELASGRFVAIRSHVLLAVGDIRTRSMLEHRAIITAIENGNLSEAESILALHIGLALEDFKNAQQEGFLSSPETRSRTNEMKLTLE